MNLRTKVFFLYAINLTVSLTWPLFPTFLLILVFFPLKASLSLSIPDTTDLFQTFILSWNTAIFLPSTLHLSIYFKYCCQNKVLKNKHFIVYKPFNAFSFLPEYNPNNMNYKCVHGIIFDINLLPVLDCDGILHT